MRVVLVTQHFLAPNYRRAGVHQFVHALAKRGHEIDFITVAQSSLKQRLKPRIRAFAEGVAAAMREGIYPPNLRGHVHRERVHPPSGSPRTNRLTKPLEWFYGRKLDETFANAARQADVIILECGYPLYYFESLKRLNPYARFVAFYMDRLDLVGFRPEILRRHERLMPQFDFVRTNSARLLDYLPPGTRGHYLPQGVDKSKMRLDLPSPYPTGSRNIVSVGDMLFDEPAVRMIAEAARSHGAQLHLIGAHLAEPPAGVVVHGEMSFDQTLPFIVNADVGLAPYRLAENTDYLIQSSLKLQQYSYCGLPVLIARGLELRRENFIYYDPRDAADIGRSVAQALARPKDRRYGRDILDWDEVASRFESLTAN